MIKIQPNALNDFDLSRVRFINLSAKPGVTLNLFCDLDSPNGKQLGVTMDGAEEGKAVSVDLDPPLWPQLLNTAHVISLSDLLACSDLVYGISDAIAASILSEGAELVVKKGLLFSDEDMEFVTNEEDEVVGMTSEFKLDEGEVGFFLRCKGVGLSGFISASDVEHFFDFRREAEMTQEDWNRAEEIITGIDSEIDSQLEREKLDEIIKTTSV